MKSIHIRSRKYSQKVSTDLKVLCADYLTQYQTHAAILVTGSLGKQHLTPGSDIDLIVLLDKEVDEAKARVDIINKLTSAAFPHQFEFYPIANLETWKWLAENSSLLCSDLFFATFIWGKKELFTDLKKHLKDPSVDERNKKIHFLYNLLYRDQQLKAENSNDIKYQTGGLRDMQSIIWIAKRIAHCRHWHPTRYLQALHKNRLITRGERITLTSYVSLIMDIKWRQEANIKIAPDQQIEYDKMRKKISHIIEKVKQRALKALFPEEFIQHISALRMDQMDHKTRDQLFTSGDENAVLCAIWNSEDIHLIEQTLGIYTNSWAIRAAVALNPNTPLPILKKLISLNFPDMSDIVDFTHKNPHFNI